MRGDNGFVHRIEEAAWIFEGFARGIVWAALAVLLYRCAEYMSYYTHVMGRLMSMGTM